MYCEVCLYAKLLGTASIHQRGVQQTYLSLLEGLSGQVSSAGSLEQSYISPGLDIALLLQPGQGACSEEHLPQRRNSCKPTQPLLCMGDIDKHKFSKQHLSGKGQKTLAAFLFIFFLSFSFHFCKEANMVSHGVNTKSLTGRAPGTLLRCIKTLYKWSSFNYALEVRGKVWPVLCNTKSLRFNTYLLEIAELLLSLSSLAYCTILYKAASAN